MLIAHCGSARARWGGGAFQRRPQQEAAELNLNLDPDWNLTVRLVPNPGQGRRQLHRLSLHTCWHRTVVGDTHAPQALFLAGDGCCCSLVPPHSAGAHATLAQAPILAWNDGRACGRRCAHHRLLRTCSQNCNKYTSSASVVWRTGDRSADTIDVPEITAHATQTTAGAAGPRCSAMGPKQPTPAHRMLRHLASTL